MTVPDARAHEANLRIELWGTGQPCLNLLRLEQLEGV